MVAVDVDIQNTRERPQQLEDAEHDIIDVAETRRFRFLCMVKPTSPVDSNVGGA